MKYLTKLLSMGVVFLMAVVLVMHAYSGTVRKDTVRKDTVRQTECWDESWGIPTMIVDLSTLDIPVSAVQERRIAAMESVLEELFNIYQTAGEAAATEFARFKKIPMTGNQVKLVVEIAPPKTSVSLQQAASMVRAGIEGVGGRVDNTYHHMIQCRVGMESLGQLACLGEVRSIRRPMKLINNEFSEGISNMGAGQFLMLPPFHGGGGTKVMVLDGGFDGYEDLIGSDLPENITYKSFVDNEEPGAQSGHGTACAEIIFDMVPSVKLYFAKILYDTDLIPAIDWAIEQGVDIISFSMGHFGGPLDGTGMESNLIKRAKEEGGIAFVTSAGNAAKEHWMGTFNDPDGDGWHNFSGDDELLQFTVSRWEFYEWGVAIILKWNEWGIWDEQEGYSGTDQDYDLYLFNFDGDRWQMWANSQNRQPDFKWPFEQISGRQELADTSFWGLGIRRNKATRNVTFNINFVSFNTNCLEYNVEAGSLSIPADSADAVSVGAHDSLSLNGDGHDYSSRGPTMDGRLKPDLAAPSRVSTHTYGMLGTLFGGFWGTSASCPHVAGAIALVKEKTPFTIQQIIELLYARCIDIGEPGDDNRFGRGRLNLKW